MISAPSVKQMISGGTSRFDLLISTPIPSPIGIIDMSTPTVNRPMPSMSIRAPNKNITIVPALSGAIETLSSSTTPEMGSTDAKASRIFSPKGCIQPRFISRHPFQNSKKGKLSLF